MDGCELRQLAVSGLPGALLPEKSVMGRFAKAGSPGLRPLCGLLLVIFPRVLRSSLQLCLYLFAM